MNPLSRTLASASIAAALSGAPAAMGQAPNAQTPAGLCLGNASAAVSDILMRTQEGDAAWEACLWFAKQYPLTAEQVERRGRHILGDPVRVESNFNTRLAGEIGASDRPAQVAEQLRALGTSVSKGSMDGVRMLVEQVGQMSEEDLRALEAYGLSGILPLLAMQEITMREERGVYRYELLLLFLIAWATLKKTAPDRYARLMSWWTRFDTYMKERRKRIDAERARRRG